MEKLFIVIPVYNEEANIKSVIEEWYPVIEKHNGNGESRLVLIDDGSKDNTYSIIQECAKKYPLIKAITKQNEGHGATILHGYNDAIENGADYIFQTDSDGQTLPSEFEQFWNCKEQHEMVIGHRSKREDGFSRYFVTKVLKVTLKLCFGVTVIDANTPFRLMKADVLKENLKLVPEKFNLSNVIISVIYAKKKYNVKYIPITFRQRQGGVNSINLKKICKIGRQAIKDFKEINKTLKEMK